MVSCAEVTGLGVHAVQHRRRRRRGGGGRSGDGWYAGETKIGQRRKIAHERQIRENV